MKFETENIEFKAQITNEIYKEVIAFANTDGGTIYIGIDDNGNEVGIDNVDDTYTRITNGIRDAIHPDVTMFVKYTLKDNHVIKITVGEGSYKPYYLQAKGLKPNGVFIRQGTSSVQASFEQIRQMIKDSDGDNWETMRSLEQEMTFSHAKKAFQKYHVEFSKKKYRTLGITDASDSLYTNLALILSDQCGHTTKVAVFGNKSMAICPTSLGLRQRRFDSGQQPRGTCPCVDACVPTWEQQRRAPSAENCAEGAVVLCILPERVTI